MSRILIVEDSPTQAVQLQFLLEEQGYDVTSVGNGKQGLTAAREQKPNLIISDIVMPVMDGHEMCHAIKEDEELQTIPVILLTALSDPADIVRGLQAGADYYVTKPYHEDHLLSTVELALATPLREIGGRAEEKLEVTFAGERHVITSGRQQLLNLLLSTYGNAVEQNRELNQTQRELERLNERLETIVEERTAALVDEVAERERAEEEIKAVNRDLETLLYVASHDLREPLRAMEMFSRMVHDRYADRLDEKGQDFLMRVVRGAERMTRLLNDLTALSRAQRMEPPTDEVEGAAIVEEALIRLGSKIRDTGAQVQVAKDLPQLRANETWATEAVYNLVFNALKFTREGAAPEVEIAPYRPQKGEPGGVGIVVRDRGPGVAPEHAERIFELFQRAVGREVEGTGAGLAIVRQVAKRHGGRAWVRPRNGGGSEFIITFGT